MPLKVNNLVDQKTYFVSQSSAILYGEKTGIKKQAVNHLLLGDWLKYVGEKHVHKWTTSKGENKSITFAKVRARGYDGWLKLEDFDEERSLEVNFVDIGQGDGCHIVTPDDKVLVIDAGIADNMDRFLSWRYNLRSRNVERAPDFDPEKETKEPWQIDYVVMSHPDADHYGGFKYLFNNPKLKFDKVYHNGIVERPFAKPPVKVAGVKYPHDLGGVFKDRGETYLYDYVTSGTALKKLLKIEPKSTKKLVTCFRALYANNKSASVGALGVNIVSLGTDTFMESFDPSEKLSMQILGPIRERPKFKGKTRLSVRTLGGEGETKNGHSIIFKARYNNLTLLLGGDLNSPAQNFLLQQYSGSKETPEKLLKTIHNLENKKQPLGAKDQTKLDKARINFENLEKAGRDIFEVDVAKACHHGSQHIIDSFIRSVNAVATVISSGDDEPHSHPRPSALGAYGKHGRGNRPLLFSTELARSTNEFTPQLKQYLAMRGIVLQIEAEPDEKKKKALEATLEGRKDRNVAVYGMITLRALGDTVIIAQKLERAAKKYRKWDIYELYYDKMIGKFVYDSH